MNHHEEFSFEAELRRLKPSRPPEVLLTRLERALPRVDRATGNARDCNRAAQSQTTIHPGRLVGAPWAWWRLRRWLAPAALATGVTASLLLWRPAGPEREQTLDPQPVSSPPVVQVDDVAIAQQLLTSYDAVVELPSGEPVRFHCQQWLDEVVWRDSTQGLVIEQQTPRLEVIPVRLEVY